MPNMNSNNQVADLFLRRFNMNLESVTADAFLMALSKSRNQYDRDVAAFVKMSIKSSEIQMVLDFALSKLRNKPFAIREHIYDTGIDGIHELDQYLIEKNSQSQNAKRVTKACNTLNWLLLRLPAKQILISEGLLYS